MMNIMVRVGCGDGEGRLNAVGGWGSPHGERMGLIIGG